MSSQSADFLFVLVLALLVQARGDNGDGARELQVDISRAVNATQNLAASAAATESTFADLKELFRTDASSLTAAVIDALDTLGVIPSQLLTLQRHVLESSVSIDELLSEVLAKMINHRALTASVNEHLMSRVDALRHDLAQLIEDTGVLIAFMDSSLDFAFARYDLLREIVLDLAHSFVGPEVAEIEALLNKTDDVLIAAYTPLSLNKFAFENHFQETVFALQNIISQIYAVYF